LNTIEAPMNLSERIRDPIELRADPVTRDTIDVADGIERLMGNRDLYARILRRFRRDYHEGALPARLALADGNSDLAHRMVHTLKGASGMIGAHRLHARATQLEHALRTDAADQREQMASLVNEFDRVLQLLDVLLEGNPPEGMPVHIEPRALLGDAALQARLIELLANGDGAAIDLLEESGASLRVILGDEVLQRVMVAVRDFKFEDALLAIGETQVGSGI
jgi:HPt (histidine-containing phosphotransfer) domain-containing protein